MKETSIKESVKLIKKNIKKHKGFFTLTDASAATGLSIDESRESLDILMSQYTCKLQVTENGDLIYNFGNTLKPRGAKSFKDIMEEIGEIFWNAFTLFFKAWITVTLVVYFIIFLILLVLMILGLSKGKNNKNIKFDWVGRIFISIFRWKTYSDIIIYTNDNDGYRYRQYESNKAIIDLKAKGKKNLIASVYDFVFGPPRVNIDPLANEKEVAAYLREKKGILTVSELVALAGWTFDQAEEVISDYVVRFKGDTDISINKVMYARFDELIRSKSSYVGGKIEYYWDEYEPPYYITGNTGGKNTLMFFMNGFNLVMAFSVLFSEYFQKFIASYNIPYMPVMIGLGVLPVIFSTIFFLVPLLRAPFVLVKERKRKETNIKKRLIKVIFAYLNKKLRLQDVINEINKADEKILSDATIRTFLDRITIELRGDKDIDDNGEIVYSFNRLADDYKEADRLRESVKIDKDLGKIEIEM